MNKYIYTVIIFIGASMGFSMTASAGDNNNGVIFPADHRAWDHVRSTVIHDKENPLFGFLSVYANPSALKANKTGMAYANGSKIVGIFHDVVDEGGIMTQGERLKYVVMVKDSQHYRDTGGWGFQAFDAAGKKALIADPKEGCFACHTSVEDRHFVFSSFVE